jgi:putative serine protease PepD
MDEHIAPQEPAGQLPEQSPERVSPAAPQPSEPPQPPPAAPVLVGSPRSRGWLVFVTSLIAAVLAGGIAGAVVSRSLAPQPAVSQISVVGSATEEPAAAAAAVALPSVVNIDVRGQGTASGLPSGHPSVPSGGTGSGVAYKAAPGGGTYIITNDHVVSGAKTIVVTPASGDALDATLVGTDPQTDVAVVKVSGTIPLVKLGDSEKLVVGQMVVAIGSPFGLQHSVSSGIVSAVHRAITGSYTQNGPASANPLVDAIQTDAAINPGNSGGALVDRHGSLVGINSAIFSDTGQSAGIGFAIPVKTAASIADQLIATGRAKHPFLGITGLTVDATLATQRKLPVTQGALIESIITGTGAAKAGLKAGDIIVAVNGEAVRSMSDVILDTRRANVGDTVSLVIWRGTAKTTIKVVVGDKPASVN